MLLLLLLMTTFISTSVNAALIENVDLDGITVGTQVAQEKTTNFIGGAGTVLTSSVFANDDIFTYILTLAPGTTSIPAEFNTGFDVAGFNGIAGYSFQDALNAFPGATGDATTAFTINYEYDGVISTLDWNANYRRQGFWNGNQTITFFFQSSQAPGADGNYNFISPASTTTSYSPAPVPVPSAIYFLGTGLLGLCAFSRKKSE